MVGNRFAVCMLTSLLAGCANLSAVHYTRHLDPNEVLVTDASQRAIISFPQEETTGQVDTMGSPITRKRLVRCAEPSPDVALAVSEVLKTSLSLDLSKATAAADPGQTKTVDAGFSRAAIASIAQLGERLAVIQLLRDKMYRACEAYGNGAIGDAAYTLILARHDKTMASLLSTEIAAGAFGRSLAQIDGNANFSGPSQDQLAKIKNELNVQIKSLRDEAGKGKDKIEPETLKMIASMIDGGVNKLVTLESSFAASITSQTKGGGALGQLPQPGQTSDARAQLAETVSTIHKNFLDDDGLDPLIDTCIVALEKFERKLTDEDKNKLALVAKTAARSTPIVDQLDALLKASKDLDHKRNTNEPSEITRKLQNALDIARIKDEDQILNAFLSVGGPFAAFCYSNLLADSSKFANTKLKQKRVLRGVAADDSDPQRRGSYLDMCTKVAQMSKEDISAADRGMILLSCASRKQSDDKGEGAMPKQPSPGSDKKGLKTKKSPVVGKEQTKDEKKPAEGKETVKPKG